MSLTQRLIFPFVMAPKEDDDAGGGLDGKSEAELAKIRGDDLEDLEEDKGEEDKDEEDKDEEKDDEEKDDDKKSKVEEKDDEDEDEEEKDEEKDEDKDDKKDVKKSQTIPKARFDSLNRKSKEKIEALTKQIEELSKKAKADTDADDTKKTEEAIEAAEKKLEQLLADGKTSEAAATMREIRVLERALTNATAKGVSEKARAVAVEQVRLDMLIERLETQYPQINPDADEYDQEIVDEVTDLKAAFEAQGKSSSEALSRAVKYVLANKIADADEKARKDDKEEQDDDKSKDKSKEKDRKKQAVGRNIKDSKKIPAKTGDHGVDSDKKGGGLTNKAVPEMTEEEFEALPESTKARMRGDTLDD